jgi:hypothetical protein
MMNSPIDDNLGLFDNTHPSPQHDIEQQQVRILFGTYADILFVLLPFFVVTIFKLWHNDLKTILMSYDLSMASAVLAGLAIVKFIVGITIDPRMMKYKEKLVFLVSGTVFLVLVPGLLLSVLIMLSANPPTFVMFIQPLLLLLAVMAYTGAVSSTNVLLDKAANQDTKKEEAA